MQTGIAAELSLKAISTGNNIAVSIHSVGGKMGNDIQIMSRENFEEWRQRHIDNGATVETAGDNTVIIRNDLNAFAVYPTESVS